MAVIHLTKDNFNEEVLEAKVPVLVDFWASWCGPCQMVGPIIEEIGDEVTDKKICKVEVDENPELARQFRVMSIPTLAVFKDGRHLISSARYRQNQKVRSTAAVKRLDSGGVFTERRGPAIAPRLALNLRNHPAPALSPTVPTKA